MERERYPYIHEVCGQVRLLAVRWHGVFRAPVLPPHVLRKQGESPLCAHRIFGCRAALAPCCGAQAAFRLFGNVRAHYSCAMMCDGHDPHCSCSVRARLTLRLHEKGANTPSVSSDDTCGQVCDVVVWY
jgi:hypothetical protein